MRLDAPAPMRASLPLLAADGVPLGVAKQSPDRRTLTITSTDPVVLTASDVRLIWSGDLGKDTGRNRGQATGPTDADWLKARRGPLLPSDPGALGKYQVETSEYNLGDEAVYLPGLGQRSELRGKVYTPKGAIGQHHRQRLTAESETQVPGCGPRRGALGMCGNMGEGQMVENRRSRPTSS